MTEGNLWLIKSLEGKKNKNRDKNIYPFVFIFFGERV